MWERKRRLPLGFLCAIVCWFFRENLARLQGQHHYDLTEQAALVFKLLAAPHVWRTVLQSKSATCRSTERSLVSCKWHISVWQRSCMSNWCYRALWYVLLGSVASALWSVCLLYCLCSLLVFTISIRAAQICIWWALELLTFICQERENHSHMLLPETCWVWATWIF